MENSKNFNLITFLKNGGNQPIALSPVEVDKYFLGNYFKRWPMMDGFLPKFQHYKDQCIHFHLITDPRCDTQYLMLCKFIASKYKEKIALLSDAKKFEVHHFIANDIVGFHISAFEIDKIGEYSQRVKKSMAELPEEPHFMHFGEI
ncbi:MAG TPA: hypothetical protein PKC30_09890 [Saprospiraceae bacterium]|nr:hypothetical protein [Saprospiraceae bacterium]